MEFFLQLAINGLVVGAIYSLVALGFVIIFKSSGILNFAQGEFLLLGAYVFLAIVAQANVPTLPALLLTFAFATLLGLVLERVILRPLIGEPVILMGNSMGGHIAIDVGQCSPDVAVPAACRHKNLHGTCP